MSESNQLSGRRPLKSRGTEWAKWLAGKLVDCGVSANAISVMSAMFALLAGGLVVLIAVRGLPAVLFLVVGVLIQCRLICNLMDGMVAIEGGKKSVVGDLFNEVPDRVADLAILVPFGLLAGGWGVHLGWLAGALAVMTAYVRLQGASLTGVHEFCGPMAKPQRMALVTGLCVLLGVFPGLGWCVVYVLGVVVLGEVLTVWRRLSRISIRLREGGC